MAYELKKTPKSVETYINCLVKTIIKEINRGNEIQFDKFGVFKPKFSGGVDKYVCGEIKYIDPRIGIEFYLTENGLNKVNKEVVNIKEKDKLKKRVLEGKLTPADKELLGVKEEPQVTQEDIRNNVRKFVDEFLNKKGWFDENETDEENEECEELEE
jgi:hypothetical protein